MLTRLRIQGFKTLYDVDIRFGPFTCIAGANGVGKSNLFDAIRFLHLLSKHPMMEAVQKVRDTGGRSAEPGELFTTIGSHREPKMRFIADLLIDREAQDDFGVLTKAAISSLQYEIAFGLDETDGMQRLKLEHESLKPTPQGEARRNLGFPTTKLFLDTAITGRRTVPFISTERTETATQITVHQEGHGGRKLPATSSTRTVLGGLASSEFPTILAAQREMESWRTLLLEPSAMRAPSRFSDPRAIDSRGGNLPATIVRLERSEDRPGRVRSSIVNRLARLLEDVRTLRLRQDDKSESWTVEVCGRDEVFHSARALSDGTLRFLVLTVVGLDPEGKGLLCLEEPENGIHPSRGEAMVDLLRGIPVDAFEAIDGDNPLRQVIINTHSPKIVQHIRQDELVYLNSIRISRGGRPGLITGASVTPNSWRASLPEKPMKIAPGDLISYLGNAVDGWLNMDYHENENGDSSPLLAGVGRAD
jgi:predicted ATPase